MLILMHREKMAGENLRNGSREVAFELWIQRIRCFILVDSNGNFRRYQGKQYRKFFSRTDKEQYYTEFRWYHGHISSP